MKIGVNNNHYLMSNFKASLLEQMTKSAIPQAAVNIEPSASLPVANPAYIPVSTPIADTYNKNSLLVLLNNKIKSFIRKVKRLFKNN